WKGAAMIPCQPGLESPADPRPAASDERRKPRRIGKFRVAEKLGAGTLGSVYRAFDSLGRALAVRLVAGSDFWTDVERTCFREACEASAKLRHPGVATLLDYGEEDGSAYVATELIEGIDLRALLAAGGASTEARLSLAWSLAETLGY